MSTAHRIVAALCPLTMLLACSPASDEITFTLQAMSFANSEWSDPVNLGAVVNSNVADIAPTLSTDGLSLYFSSNRPGGFGGGDLWVSQRACTDADDPACAWQTPANLGAVINTPAIENRPALSNDGHLMFFFSDRSGGQGGTDIWLSRRLDPKDDFGWEPPVNLGPNLNTPGAEQAPFYQQSAEDGAGNLYFARGLSTANAQDIYVSPVDRDGQPRGFAVIVSELSDPTGNDAGPSVRADGREIFFGSSRTGTLGMSDLYTSNRRSVHEPWSTPVNLGALFNTSAFEQQPSLSHDGRTLVWASNRPGSIINPSGVPSFDIWMSTRTVSGQEEP